HVSTEAWTPTGSLTTRRADHTATLLPDGRVLVAGGGTAATAELYNSPSGTWTATSSLIHQRSNHTATLLPDGNVLVAGGYDSGSISSAELYVEPLIPSALANISTRV